MRLAPLLLAAICAALSATPAVAQRGLAKADVSGVRSAIAEVDGTVRVGFCEFSGAGTLWTPRLVAAGVLTIDLDAAEPTFAKTLLPDPAGVIGAVRDPRPNRAGHVLLARLIDDGGGTRLRPDRGEAVELLQIDPGGAAVVVCRVNYDARESDGFHAVPGTGRVWAIAPRDCDDDVAAATGERLPDVRVFEIETGEQIAGATFEGGFMLGGLSERRAVFTADVKPPTPPTAGRRVVLLDARTAAERDSWLAMPPFLYDPAAPVAPSSPPYPPEILAAPHPRGIVLGHTSGFALQPTGGGRLKLLDADLAPPWRQPTFRDDGTYLVATFSNWNRGQKGGRLFWKKSAAPGTAPAGTLRFGQPVIGHSAVHNGRIVAALRDAVVCFDLVAPPADDR